MRSPRTRLASGCIAAASLALVVAGAGSPASAATAGPASGVLHFYSGVFTGQSVDYAAPGPGCTKLPFVVHSELNSGDQGIDVYRTPDCTGAALHFPANDIHSFTGFDGLSFRPAG